MGQGDVFLFLEKNPQKWWTAKEISKNINTSKHNISASCCKLYKFGEILKKYTVKYNPERKKVSFTAPYLWKINKKRSKLLSLL